MVTEPIDAPYIGIPIQITKWGQYEGELETVPMASWASASEAGRAMGAPGVGGWGGPPPPPPSP